MRLFEPFRQLIVVATAWLFLAGIVMYSPQLIGAQESGQESEAQILQNENQASPSATASPSPESQVTPTIEEPGVTTIAVDEITGEVMKVSGNTLTVETDGETLDLVVPSNIQITRDGQNASLTDIQPGDEVIAEVDSQTNQVLSLEVRAQDAIWNQEWLLPAIIGGLLLLGIIIWLIRRSSRGRIKTTQTNLG